jgi:hypothetical protein
MALLELLIVVTFLVVAGIAAFALGRIVWKLTR